MFQNDTRRQVQAIGAATACIAVVGIGLSLSIPLLAFAMDARGVSSTMIGLNTSMAGIATIIVAPFVPRAAAKLGVRTLILLALALGAVTFVGFWYAEAFWLWFPLRFLMGTSLAVLFVLSEFWINAAAPEKARGLVMGIYATVLSLGFAAGPTILALFDRNSILPYLIGAALFVAAALPVAFASGLAPKLDDAPHSNILRYLLAAPSAVAAAFVFGAVETGGMSFLPLYGLRMGYGEVAAAMLVSILALGNVLVQIPLGLISDKMDRRKLLLTLGIIGALGAALMPFVAHRTGDPVPGRGRLGRPHCRPLHRGPRPSRRQLQGRGTGRRQRHLHHALQPRNAGRSAGNGRRARHLESARPAAEHCAPVHALRRCRHRPLAQAQPPGTRGIGRHGLT